MRPTSTYKTAQAVSLGKRSCEPIQVLTSSYENNIAHYWQTVKSFTLPLRTDDPVRGTLQSPGARGCQLRADAVALQLQ